MSAGEVLKACPFCGSSSIDPEGWMSEDAVGPACNHCGASANSVKQWNDRVAPAAPVAQSKSQFRAAVTRRLELQDDTISHIKVATRKVGETVDEQLADAMRIIGGFRSAFETLKARVDTQGKRLSVLEAERKLVKARGKVSGLTAAHLDPKVPMPAKARKAARKR